MLGLENSEMNLVKLIFYPLAWRCICDKSMEVGLIPKFWGGEVLAYMICCWSIPQTYLLEKKSCIPAVHKLVLNYSRDPKYENRIYDHAKMLNNVSIYERYLKGTNPKYNF